MTDRRSIFIGFDPREADAFAVARHSIQRRLVTPIPIYGLVLSHLRSAGLYYRPTSIKDGRLWDDISEAPCSTEFSISRFAVPWLARQGLALFCDADVLARANVEELFDWVERQPKKAVWCVQHNHVPSTATKMDNQIQVAYARKNWSSVCVWDLSSQSVRALTPQAINTLTGRELHQFKFLGDDEIGALPKEWNHLIGEYQPNPDAKLAHFTLGIPSMAGYSDCEFADEWRKELANWAA